MQQTRSTSLVIANADTRTAALTLRAINHKLRQQILQMIYTKGRSVVTEIYTTLRLEQSVASQHLAILRKAGFVSTTRDGKFIYYTVNDAYLKKVQALAKELCISQKD